jgi:predicted nucleotidyltransferase component of viral defense system
MDAFSEGPQNLFSGHQSEPERQIFRGGTAINKLLFRQPLRYSEDIDLVQVRPAPMAP